eukprot:jgi/Psemu1/230267/e_gw1.3107.2.1
MSFRERVGIQEEIHGVDCLAREETPELLEDSLRRLDIALQQQQCDDNYFDSDPSYRNIQSAFRISQISQSQQQQPQQQQDFECESTTTTTTTTTFLTPRSYVNTREFRLRFLRCTLFDPKRAAKKIVDFLHVAESIFGEEVLERPIRYNDLNSRERQYLRKGHCQFLPFRDRSGRRILAMVNATLYSGDSTLFLQAKALMYMVWTAGCDVDTQRKGIIYLGWFDSAYTPQLKLRHFTNRVDMSRIFCVRPGAIHICSPDRPVYRFLKNLVMVQATQPNRPKLIFHLGESVELRYQLKSYGIPTDHIPISVTGTIKVGYIKQWMRTREVIEEIEDANADAVSYCNNNNNNINNIVTDSDTTSTSTNASGTNNNNSYSYNNNNNNNNNIVECPKLEDVLFRQGISLNTNPGNGMIRRLVIAAYSDPNVVRVKRRKMVLTILEEVRKTGGRFLMWNEEGWWNELVLCDEENSVNGAEDLLIAKVEYVIKDVRREQRISVRKKQQQNQNHVKVNSSTSIFCSQDGGGTDNCLLNNYPNTNSDEEENNSNSSNNNNINPSSMVQSSSSSSNRKRPLDFFCGGMPHHPPATYQRTIK